MKKAKIMLIAIAVIATVGGALAFKAQKFVQTKYCTTIVDPQRPQDPGICEDFVEEVLTTDGLGEEVFTAWYTTTNDNDCDGGIQCAAASTTFYAEL